MDFLSSMFGGTTMGLQTNGSLSKDQFLTFSSRCRALFASPDFRRTIKALAAGGQVANDVIEMKQKELFEEQGIQGAFGIKQLGSIGRLYPADATVQASFMALVSAEDQVLDEIELSPEAYAAKWAAAASAQSAQEDFAHFLHSLPADQHAAFTAALFQASSRTIEELPLADTVTPDELPAFMVQRVALTKRCLAEAGFVVPDAAPGESTPAATAGPAISAMSAAEQERFFETVNRSS